MREPTPGQMMVTVENDGCTNAVNVALVASRIRWGGLSPDQHQPRHGADARPEQPDDVHAPVPALGGGHVVTLCGTDTGRNFSGLTRVTP